MNSSSRLCGVFRSVRHAVANDRCCAKQTFSETALFARFGSLADDKLARSEPPAERAPEDGRVEVLL